MIKLIVLDVDGTLTDGRLYMDDKDNCLKAFDVKDGFAIAQWIKLGGLVAIITGKTSEIVRRRKEELGIQELAQGVSNKLLVKYSLSLDEVAYIGDDINDLGVMSKVGFSACPKDAVSEVLERVDYIASKNGGRGAVREIFEKLMKENGMWNKVLERYLNENENIKNVHDIFMRKSGDKVFLSMHIRVPKEMTVYEAHNMIDSIREGIVLDFENVKDVMIHVDYLH